MNPHSYLLLTLLLLTTTTHTQTLNCASGMKPDDLIQTGNTPLMQAHSPPSPPPSPTTTDSTPT